MSDELDLFQEGGADEASGTRGRDDPPAPEHEEGSDPAGTAPLAARMRPRTLDEVRGQDHLLGEGCPLRAMLEGGGLSSMILWGPPGSGKTTLARLLARRTDAAFVPFSAVTGGVGKVREIVSQAEARAGATGRRTILFCDEIHRFNRAQQDAFLPHVEEGTLVLVGATTENPSFEINRPLLSRAPVFLLEPLSGDDLGRVLEDAVADAERGLGRLNLRLTERARDLLADGAAGDARRALNALEAAAELAGPGGTVDETLAREALQHRFAHYDKSGEEHYNVVSALHKAVRGGDPDGALYWLARMLDGGEDPAYIARRLVRIAAEDVGLAEPAALRLAVAGWDAYHFLGSPEGELALAEVTVFLATAPKSNKLYEAWGRALESARETPAEPVPLHIRNAPTELMRDLGYGRGYRYDPNEPGEVAVQRYLPPRLEEARFYEPGEAGYEEAVSRRLRRWRAVRESGKPADDPDDAGATDRPSAVEPEGGKGAEE